MKYVPCSSQPYHHESTITNHLSAVTSQELDHTQHVFSLRKVYLIYQCSMLTLSDEYLLFVEQLHAPSLYHVLNLEHLSNILTLCHFIRHSLEYRTADR